MSNIKRINYYELASMQIKDIVMGMNGLSEEEFMDKYRNDIYFNKGFNALVRILMESNLLETKRI